MNIYSELELIKLKAHPGSKNYNKNIFKIHWSLVEREGHELSALPGPLKDGHAGVVRVWVKSALYVVSRSIIEPTALGTKTTECTSLHCGNDEQVLIHVILHPMGINITQKFV